jgi:hypothetical protein
MSVSVIQQDTKSLYVKFSSNIPMPILVGRLLGGEDQQALYGHGKGASEARSITVCKFRQTCMFQTKGKGESSNIPPPSSSNHASAHSNTHIPMQRHSMEKGGDPTLPAPPAPVLYKVCCNSVY